MKIYPSSLNGEISITGAKNAVLRYLAASILTDKEMVLENYPLNMLDVNIHEEMLAVLGKTVAHVDNICKISGSVNQSELIWDKRSIRNTLLILGCLLAKTGLAKVPLPGGCPLGDRKYDIHVDLIKAFGGKVWEENGYLCSQCDGRLKGCDFHLRMRSTGATENAILMATLAEGQSRIWNPHIRPEILDLINLLNKMGADITVNGPESIIINGKESLTHNVVHYSLSDNMQALTYLIAGGIAGEELIIKNFPFRDLEIPLYFLEFSGLKYYRHDNELIVRRCTPYPIDISTGPYPGINSDMQPLFAVWGALSKGKSSITDLRFKGRYAYADELAKMGVVSQVEGNTLEIMGGNAIHGGTVTALDLRAGAALMLMALVADSPTKINDFWMIERGYDDVRNVLQSIGIKIEE